MRNTALHTKILAMVGIAALLVQMNAVPLDYLLFRLNQGQISRTLCEHKMPHCNGHCFLMKQMAKSNNVNGDKKTERSGAQLDGHFLLSALNNLTLFPTPINFLTHLAQHVVAGWSSPILQPPRFA